MKDPSEVDGDRRKAPPVAYSQHTTGSCVGDFSRGTDTIEASAASASRMTTASAAVLSNNNSRDFETPVFAAAASAGTVTTSNDKQQISSSTTEGVGIVVADDFTTAQRWQAVEQLSSIFGFPLNVAEDAVDAVGWDVTTCYNYILDQQLAEDSGGAIFPIDNCPHLQQHIHLDIDSLVQALEGHAPQDAPCSHYAASQPSNSKTKTMTKRAKVEVGSLKEDVEDDGSCPSKENWICLECGVIRCSRYKNGHSLAHWGQSKALAEGSSAAGGERGGHCVAISFSDLSVWCYLCSAYVRHPTLLDPLLKQLETLKGLDDDDEVGTETRRR